MTGPARLAASAWRSTDPLLSPRAADRLMVAAGITGAAAILWLCRGWDLFFYDEWGTIFYRSSGGLDAFLAPHNGHLQAVVVAVYRALFATAGLEHYLPYRLAILLAHVALVALIYLYARRRVQPELAVVLALLVLMLGAGWEVIFWPYTLGFPVQLAALIGVLLLWERTGRRAVAGRVALLLISVASSGLGVAVVAAAAVEALRRPDRWQRLAEPGIAAVVYASWFLFYRPSGSTPAELRQIPGATPTGDVGTSGVDPPSPGQAVGYLGELAQAGVSGLLRIDPATGGWVALAALLVVLAVFVTRPSARGRLLSLATGLAVFWLSLVAARGAYEAGPVASRYVYVSAVFIVLMATEALRGVSLRRPVIGVVAVLLVIVTVSDVRTFQRISDGAAATFERNREQLRGLGDPSVPAGYEPDPESMPGVTAGPYREITSKLGHPPGTAP